MLQHRPPIRVSWTPTARPLQRGPLSPARRGGGVVNTADPVTLTACKSSIRIISKSKYNSHSDPIFKQLEILKVPDDKKLQELIFFHKFKNTNLPTYFQNDYLNLMASSSTHSTRHSNILIYPRFRHEYMRKHLKYSLTKTVNESPAIITDKATTHSMKGYINYIKKNILSEYSDQCTIQNCYTCNTRSS